MRRATAAVLVAFAACGTTEEPEGPKLCTDVCGTLFGACGLSRIQLTGADGAQSASLDADGCVDHCAADRSRREAFVCVQDVLQGGGCAGGPSAEIMDRISGCLSTNACTQARLSIGACYGAAATAAIADPATGCTGKLSAWKPCLTCLSGRVCTEFCRECAEACQVGPVDDSVCGPAGGAGGGGGGGPGGGGGG